MADYNKRYYQKAVDILQNASFNHYYDNLIEDCAKHIKRYFPQAKLNEIKHAVNWALADAWNDGCEIETI